MDFKNQWDQDEAKENKESDNQPAVDLDKETAATNDVPIAAAEEIGSLEKIETSEVTTEPTPKHDPATVAANIYPKSTTPTFGIATNITAATQDTAHKARRFLVAYITSVFSAVAILYGTAWLGYVLVDHFFGPKKEDASLFYIDFAPFYISVMASLIVFGAAYIVASRYVAKSASDDTIGLKDWRAYKVVYAFFSALLITTGASIVAGLLYIPLAQLMIADDLDSKRILVQTLASLHVLLWIGILIWQERLVKKAKQSWLQGFVVVAGVAIVVIATGVFPVGSKTDARYDSRAANDLSAIQSAISDYKDKNDNKLPDNLAALKFEEDDTTKNRIKDYTYTVKASSQSPTSNQQSTKVNATILSKDTTSDEELSDDEYYDALYKSMYSDKSESSFAVSQSYEICATFRTDTTAKKESDGINAIATAFSGSSGLDSYSFTSHKSGKVCFTRN